MTAAPAATPGQEATGGGRDTGDGTARRARCRACRASYDDAPAGGGAGAR